MYQYFVSFTILCFSQNYCRGFKICTKKKFKNLKIIRENKLNFQEKLMLKYYYINNIREIEKSCRLF